MEISLNGTVISNDVQIKECVYDSRCDGKLSCLRIVADDDGYVFGSYGIKANDVLAVSEGNLNSKKMFVSELRSANANYEITAHPVDKRILDASGCREWKSVKLKKILGDIAKKNGLEVQFYGIPNAKYAKIVQDRKERDVMFAEKRAILEGCFVTFFDGKMVVASRDYLFRNRSGDVFDVDDFDVSVKEAARFQTCVVVADEIRGKYSLKAGEGIITVPIDISSIEEGKRFAKNILDYKNGSALVGCIKTDEIMDSYSAGTVIKLASGDYPNAAGDVFIRRVRHDLIHGKSKIWFEKMEG